MAIALRSSSQISDPILPAGAFTATSAVRETGPAGAPKPRLLHQVREAGEPIELAAEAQVISRSPTRCITARERRRTPQGRGNAGAHGAGPGSLVVPYRTTQPDVAVQGTEH